MITVMDPVHGGIDIPEWVGDLESFLRWRHSDDVPEKLKVHFINGRVWVDLFMEEFFSHNQVKSALGDCLGGFIRRGRLGVYVPDGMLFKNATANIGTEPDAMFVSRKTLEKERVTFTAGLRRGARATVLVGTPDVVVEIISRSSEDKDAEWLMSAYHNAGIPEYWLIDARTTDVRFDVFKRGPKGYSAGRKVEGGWVKSAVFGKSFRLTCDDSEKVPYYSLDIR